MSLITKQAKFASMLSVLLAYAEHRPGYLVTLAESFRSQAEQNRLFHEGKTKTLNSLHRLRLAQDLNLFIDGTFQTTTQSHAELGDVWRKLGGAWGGDFDDGNHYSLEHEGRR